MTNEVYCEYKSDEDRNRFYTIMSLELGTQNSYKYINGILHRNRTPVTDKVFIEQQELMFERLRQRSKLLSKNNKF